MATAIVATTNTSRPCELAGVLEIVDGSSCQLLGMGIARKPDRPHTSCGSARESRNVQQVLLASWDGPDDPRDPFNWPERKKWSILGLGLVASFICSMNGTILSVAHNEISEEFGISETPFPNPYWITTSWGIGAAIFPLALFPLMEDWGVRPLLLCTYFCFTCLLVPVGLAPNFATLVVVRFFTGGCVPLMSDAVASITSNVFYGDRARSVPICLYVLVYLGATSLGPVVGASILQFLGWRWIGYIELIFTAALFPILFLALPETRELAILRADSKDIRREGRTLFVGDGTNTVTTLQLVTRSIRRPVYMLLNESVVFVAAIWAAFSLGTIYLFTDSVRLIYGQLYGWNDIQAGYVQSAIVIGEILGTGLSLYANRWYFNSTNRNTEAPETPIPEARLYAAIIGGFFGVTGGMLTYAWAAYPSYHWAGITAGLAMVGFGTTAVVISLANYLVDAYSKYAASALAAVGMVENLSIAFLPLATPAMYGFLGLHWASTILGLVSLVLVATPLIVIKWGKDIRERSPYMKEATVERQRGPAP